MNIEIGKYYENRTRKYLLPCLVEHGNNFVDRYSTVFKLAVGIHDCLLDGSSKSDTRNVYILCDSKYQTNNFQNFLYWIRLEDYYVTDYAIDAEVKNSRKHMIVLLVPKKFEQAYDNFKLGRYSEMYTTDQIDALFHGTNDSSKDTKKILKKDISMRKVHCNRVNEEYESNSIPSDFKDSELDFPIQVHPETEIFNYYLNNRHENK